MTTTSAPVGIAMHFTAGPSVNWKRDHRQSGGVPYRTDFCHKASAISAKRTAFRASSHPPPEAGADPPHGTREGHRAATIPRNSRRVSVWRVTVARPRGGARFHPLRRSRVSRRLAPQGNAPFTACEQGDAIVFFPAIGVSVDENDDSAANRHERQHEEDLDQAEAPAPHGGVTNCRCHRRSPCRLLPATRYRNRWSR